MFNLGFSEILIIGVLALLLIGPQQLPEVAKVLGRMMNEFKKATSDLSGGLLDMKEELKKPMQEGLGAIADVQDAIHDGLRAPIDEIANFGEHQYPPETRHDKNENNAQPTTAQVEDKKDEHQS